ncbi:MAG: hypothetical protein ABIZ70_01505 [Gemmatimonadales bacterium]
MKLDLALSAAFVLVAFPLHAQGPASHQHVAGMEHDSVVAPARTGASGGQAAFAAISETVRQLTADPTTDWSRVNIEALRQHLIDMDNVTLRAAVRSSTRDGGLSMDVTGAGEVGSAVRRMVAAHGRELDKMGRYSAVISPIPGGVRMVVTAREAGDAATTQRIRALGFAGLMTEGDHHAAHHLMLARGEAVHQH